ncbi:DciA family protein [Amycolatopsis nigrescens]|uniref:DciA family protein n=1 Tax=Amycolatopsis nigrescens TaxID=381445 RepID=UPI0012FB94F2|nr:DciA family protein [Amycolatopsis nigrescens]
MSGPPAGVPPVGTERDDVEGGAGPNGTPASGRDLAKAALQAARDKASARGAAPGARKPGTRQPGLPGQNPRRRRWSGAGADARDPQPLGRLASRLAVERGWNNRLANGQVFGQWAKLVGEEVAEHAQPVSLREGELVVQATSTAWAMQLRSLQKQLLTKIAAGVGHGVVRRMRIHGPTAPSWRKGPRHVSGRGPRDTYG